MKIVVTEEIETVGWDEAMADAPKDIAEHLRAGTKKGLPVVCGCSFDDQRTTRTWVVVSYGQGRPIVTARVSEPAPAEPKS